MADVLTGNPSNVTSPLGASVSSLANNGAGLVRVATSTPHLFGSGDIVIMNAPPAVGGFSITVIDSTHFDLVDSTYTANGTGSVIDISLTPQILVPTDGDTQSAQISGLLSAFQGVLDRTQYLATASPSLTNFNERVIANSGQLSPTDQRNFIACNTTAGAITITLPLAASIARVPAWRFYIFYDTFGNAGTNNVTIATSGSDVFAASAGTSVKISTNYGYVAILTDGGFSGPTSVSNWYSWDQNTYNHGEILAILVGAQIQVKGTVAVQSGGAVQVQSGGVVDLAFGAAMNAASGSTVSVAGDEVITGSLTAAAGSTLNVAPGAILGIAPPAVYTPTIVDSLASGTITLSPTQCANALIRLAHGTAITGTLTIVFPTVPFADDGTTWMLDINGVGGDSGTIYVQVGSLLPVVIYSGSAIAKTLWTVQVNGSTGGTVVG